MANRRASLNFKLKSEVSSSSLKTSDMSLASGDGSSSESRTKRRDIDANLVVGDDELWADFQRRLRQSKHNVTSADTRRMFQEFLLEQKKIAADADAAEQNSLNALVGQDGGQGTGESSAAGPGPEGRRSSMSLVEAAAASTTSTAKNLFRRMSMISTASVGSSVRSINSNHSSRKLAATARTCATTGSNEDEDGTRRGSLGSLGSLGALYNNIVGAESDSDDDDIAYEDLLGRMVGTSSSYPGRLGMLQKTSSDRATSNWAQSNRNIYQMAQEVGNAAAGDNSSRNNSAASTQPSILQSHRGQQKRRGSIADRLGQVAAMAKMSLSSLEAELDGEDDGHGNDGHGAYSGIR